jgi:light-regulated signal transduction histidine kinase (bacteriophytochrome)
MTHNAAIQEEFKQYAYSVSHDVSAPVRAMVEFSKLLSSEEANALSPDGKEYLALIIENGYKLQTMMDGLLQYSRLNTLAKPFETVDLNFIASSVLTELEEQITNSHAVIDIKKLPIVDADPEQMRKLFYALIDNAIKFHASGNIPAIHISVEKQQTNWIISVADNGIGIAPRNYETIFQIFKRLHTDDEYPGVGIGLALAKKIVERHGGTIFCKVLAPSGTIFTITLPTQET